MRRSIISVVAVAGSLTLAAGGLAASSEAKTAKELNICWNNQSQNGALDLEVVADGPSYKTASLDNGDCMAWDVRRRPVPVHRRGRVRSSSPRSTPMRPAPVR